VGNPEPSDAGARAGALEREVLGRISPSPDDEARLALVRDHLLARAAAAAQELGVGSVRPLIAGSAARGTYLRQRVDVDLFLLFPASTSRADLERQGLALAASILPGSETHYAEHPYRRGTFEGFAVDAVPGFAVTDPAHPQSAVDRTPFHQEYLQARHTPATAGQVRLAKQFLLSLGVYGSEARTAGFSGYLVELLILRFQSLRAWLTEARGWRIPVRLLSAPNIHPTVPDDVALLLDDPVDPGRNVATALSRRNLALLILAADAYLTDPRPSFFEVTPPARLARERGLSLAAERGTHITVVRLPRPDLVDDILYPQIRKAERALADQTERLGFRLVGSASGAGPSSIVVPLEVESATVPAVRRQDGPPAGIDRVGSYLAKWTAPEATVLQGPYVTADGKLAVEARRPERHLEPLLVGSLERLSLGRDLTEAWRGASVRPLGEESSDEALERALAELLAKRLPWTVPRA
jgi:tRNA nucleotidyltransferase (CCA-adding enzyme)